MRYFQLILFKTYADLKAEAARSYLGFLWWVIEPVLYLGAFYILFVLVLHRGGPNFVPFFLCGAVVWKWFDSGIKVGSQSIRAHLGLLQQVYVPKYIFPIIAVLNSTARFLPLFIILLIFLLLYGIHAQLTWLSAPIVMLAEFVMVMAISMLVGAITPYLPDLKVIIDNGMMLIFFTSGIFFNINEVDEPLRSYLFLNPMAVLVDEFRNILIYGHWPNIARLAIITFSSFAIGIIALLLLKHLDRQYGKVGL